MIGYRNNLPNVGDIVKTRKYEGEVVDLEILTQKVIISPGEGEVQEVELKDIIEVVKR